MDLQKQTKKMQATQKRKGKGARLCFFGSNIDGTQVIAEQCVNECLPGADYCAGCFDTGFFWHCGVQCCDFRRGRGSNSPFCPSHSAEYREWIAKGEHSNGSPKEWLAARPNLQAARLAGTKNKSVKGSLPGFSSLAASALALSFLVLFGAIYTLIVAALLGDLGLFVGAVIVFFFWAVLLGGFVVSELKRSKKCSLCEGARHYETVGGELADCENCRGGR